MSSPYPVIASPTYDHWRGTILLLFALALIKGVLFASIIPLGQGPDEPAHVVHTLLYARQARLQILGLHDPSIDQRPLWSSMFWPAAFYEQPDILENMFKMLRANRFWELVEAPPPHPVAAYEMARSHLIQYVAPRRYTTPMYFYLASLPLRWFKIESVFGQWLFLRMVSVSLGLGVIGFTYATAKLFWPKEDWPAFAAAAFLAFLPQFSFLSSVVTPDNLIAFLSSATLYTACRVGSVVTKGTGVWVPVALGLSCAAVKEQGIAVFVFSLSILPLLLLWTRQNHGRFINRSIIVLVGIALASFIIVFLLYGTTPFDRAARLLSERVSNPAPVFFVSPLVYVRFFLIAFVSFWFSYGWAVYKMSLGWNIIFAAISILAAIGVLRAVVVERRRNSIDMRCMGMAIALFVICVFSVVIVLGPGADGVQARHFFAAFPAIAILLTMGLSEVPNEQYLHVALRGFTIFMLFLNTIALTKYLLPLFYLGRAHS